MRKKYFLFLTLPIIFLALFATPNLANADAFTLLHSFAGGSSDGQNPYGSLTLSGSVLYGMTYLGGSSNYGTIFSINTDGTGLTVLHSFAGGSSDGQYPLGSLTLSGSVIYGMTKYGGSSNYGTIFSINTDGTNFTLLHTFTGSSSDGALPYSSLTLAGSVLYGATRLGGSSGGGVIFSIHTDGTGFNLLHSFTGGSSDGQYCYSSLTLSGSVIYGMTEFGGSSGNGTIFSINTDGTNFTLLHTFIGGSSDGQNPIDPLTIFGSVMYGTTAYGGSSGDGVIFSINTDGTNFTLLHTFTGGSSDGQDPFYGSLTRSGSVFYGMTHDGGASSLGTIFSMNIDGTGFTILHSFAGGSSDGQNPFRSLTLSGDVLYGMTYSGGISNDGTIFSYNTNLAPTIVNSPVGLGPEGKPAAFSGQEVTFTATASDPEGDPWYLAVCKTNSITPNTSSAPTCPGGSYATSTQTVSNQQAQATYTAQKSDQGIWYAFACDNNASSLCSTSTQGQFSIEDVIGTTLHPQSPTPTPAPTFRQAPKMRSTLRQAQGRAIPNPMPMTKVPTPNLPPDQSPQKPRTP